MKIQKIIMILATVVMSSLLLMAAVNSEGDLDETEVATLSGTVVDAEMGEGIPGAEVVIEEAGKSTTTDEYGTFTFSKIEKGMYTLTVDAENYAPEEEKVQVTEEGATIEVELEPESK